MQFEVDLHRRLKNYTRFELFCRIVWAFLRPAFSLSPRFFYGWRNSLLRCLGARIGRGVRIYPSARIFAPWELDVSENVTIGADVNIYNIGPVTIGDNTIISQGAHLCAGSHDYQQPHFPLLRCPIAIGRDVWICAEAFVGPGVAVGGYSIVGARSAVFSNVEPHSIVGGNPAKSIRKCTPRAQGQNRAA